MQLRRLGGTGLVTSAIGLNCLSFTTGCGAFDRATARNIIASLPDIGVNLLDATDFTLAGEVESFVGEVLQGRRDDVILASRGGARWTPRGACSVSMAAPLPCATTAMPRCAGWEPTTSTCTTSRTSIRRCRCWIALVRSPLWSRPARSVTSGWAG